MAKIRVLLVDDSGFMRMVLSDIVNANPDLEVVDTAADGKEAVEKTKLHHPDVVLLDLTMKDYDGLYAVKYIMKECPTPIVILSAMGNTQPDAYVEALNAGAYDFLNKPTGIINSKIREIDVQIYNKIRQAARVDVGKLRTSDFNTNTYHHTFDRRPAYDAIIIGSSTGGTGAIEQIVNNIPGNLPVPVLIAQHMPAEFIHSFAARLNDLIPLKVKVANEGEIIKPGTVYIAPGDANLIVKRVSEGMVKTAFTQKDYEEFNHPSVDALMESAAKAYGKRAIGIMLTGMGKDGTYGMGEMYKLGAFTIAQDEKTSIVWGMPKAAYEAGFVKTLLPLNEIAGFIVGCLS